MRGLSVFRTGASGSDAPAFLEGSHSGLVHRLGKAACSQGHREFESRPLRQLGNEVI